MSFQKIVLLIATIILIIVLVMFGIALKNKKEDDKYPPVQSQCPDYWDMNRNKNGSVYCENTKHLGNDKCQKSVDFFKPPYVGLHGKCNKQKWAKTCGITWDGITNATGLC